MPESTSPPAALRPPPKVLLILAYGAVYVIWGSTYLAIRVGVQTVPPFLMAGLRFSIAGWILLVAARAAGAPWPLLADWRRAAVVGILMLAGGNGLVVWAEREVASSTAALVIATTPLWFVLLDWARAGGSAPAPRAFAGVALGLAGVAVLSLGGAASDSSSTARGLAALVFASLSWALGSVRARRDPRPASPWTGAAAQMISGGAAMLLISFASGEARRFAWSGVSSQSWAAVAYLIVFGSWAGYSAYLWLLRVEPPARASTYAYVNPIVAVFLGWSLGGEPVTARVWAAGALIVAGVACLLWPGRTAKP